VALVAAAATCRGTGTGTELCDAPGDGPTIIAPERSPQAGFGIWIDFNDADPLTHDSLPTQRVFAELFPGRVDDERGCPVVRSVLDDTLTVFGQALLPAIASDGVRIYRHLASADPDDFPDVPVDFDAPVVDGVPFDLPAFAWYGFGRADPDTVSFGSGDSLVFRFETPAAASDPVPSLTNWWIQLESETDQVMVVEDGDPPGSVVMARPTGGDWDAPILRARARRQQLFYMPGGTGEESFFVGVTFTTELHWIVRIVEE
jgi:hypothetical protein